MTTLRRFVFNPIGVNCYLASDEDGTAVVIDPGFLGPEEKDRLLSAISGDGLSVKAVLLTHAHLDHIWGVRQLQDELGVPVHMSPDDAPLLGYGAQMAAGTGLPAPDTAFTWTPVSDGDVLRFGKMAFKAIATPGHTPGGICYLDESEGLLFTGDTLFAGTIGRTDLPLGSYDDLIASVMDKLMGLGGDVRVLPGHGAPSTIGSERVTNPFLEPWGEAEED